MAIETWILCEKLFILFSRGDLIQVTIIIIGQIVRTHHWGPEYSWSFSSSTEALLQLAWMHQIDQVLRCGFSPKGISRYRILINHPFYCIVYRSLCPTGVHEECFAKQVFYIGSHEFKQRDIEARWNSKHAHIVHLDNLYPLLDLARQEENLLAILGIELVQNHHVISIAYIWVRSDQSRNDATILNHDRSVVLVSPIEVVNT